MHRFLILLKAKFSYQSYVYDLETPYINNPRLPSEVLALAQAEATVGYLPSLSVVFLKPLMR